jgi:uncharacterized repeat protein (TIGR02543 family)
LQGGNGGNGFWTDISGAYTGYCGGGAGSGVYGGQGIPGTVQAGAGGGGPQNESRDGRPNSGGGGGGIVGDFFAGNGGDGIVIVRYSVALYTVTYNANGATSGTAPASQTKIAGTSLTLASNSGNLARPGYFFVGWNTAADGSGTLYAAGGSYTTDASVTLYAKWYALPTYTITYNANGATSGTVPASQTKTNGIPLTLASNSGNLARTGYTFAGWNTAAAGSGTSYAAGANYTVNVSVTLYAKWAVATRILAVANNNANQRPLLQWITAGGATYTVLKSTNLLTGWSPVFTGSAGTAGSTNVFTDTNAVERSAFYKIRIP